MHKIISSLFTQIPLKLGKTGMVTQRVRSVDKQRQVGASSSPIWVWRESNPTNPFSAYSV